MALHLSAPGLDAQDMANSSMFTQISKDALQVGDIMDHPPAGPSGHVVLFNGWTSSARTSYDAYEFGDGSQPAHHVIPYPYFSWDPTPASICPFHYKGLVSASPSTVVYAAAANTGVLRVNGHPVDASVPLVAAGTSPSIAAVGSSYLVAFQAATTHHLIVVNSALQATDTKYGMAAGTSPSITGLANGKYEIAFQANTGQLWTVPDHGNSGDGMMAGTSPSITAVGSGYTVAFQANTGDLWEFPSTTNSGVSMKSGMKAGTSPSITTVAGQVEVAMQANAGRLYSSGRRRPVSYRTG